jgi:lysophospholipase L1-like esterase
MRFESGVLVVAAGMALCVHAETLKFDFGSGNVEPYSEERGLGFEPGSTVRAGKGFVTGDQPFYFSAKVPEGNYRVTVTLGDPDGESTTTIKAELRRLMVEKIHTAKGKFETVQFIVNVRTPSIPPGGEVKLKPREKTTEAIAWDNKLTLEFSNNAPKVRSIAIETADVPTLYIAGDSTSTDQPREPFNSWGQMLTRFFKPDIAVANHGESGESLKSFIGARRFEKLESLLKPGDWLLIQMGHNDQKEKGEGVGAFTTYKASLKQMIAAARAHGTTPILVTSMNRLTFDADGKITNSLGDYPEAVRQTAKEEHLAVIDLNAMSKPFYEALGPVKAHVAFAGKDTTHHSDYGSYEFARCVVQGIKDARLPLAKHLVDVPAFDPSHPDTPETFDVPPDPVGPAERPYGN